MVHMLGIVETIRIKNKSRRNKMSEWIWLDDTHGNIRAWNSDTT